MAMDAKVGFFKTGTGTDDIVVSGLGFTPEVLIVWWSGRTDSTDASGGGDYNRGFGVAASPTDRHCIMSFELDAQATSSSRTRQSPSAIVLEMFSGGGISGQLDLKSFDADGFTVDVDNTMPADRTIHYLALGGDITGAATGAFQTTASTTGSIAVTGVGFQPELVIVFGGIRPDDAANQLGSSQISIGAATGPSNEFVLLTGSDSGEGTSNTIRYGYGDELAVVTQNFTALNIRLELTSLDADGFTVNVIENGIAQARSFMFLALAGGQYRVGDFVTATDTSNFSTTGVGFQPTAVMFLSHCAAESTQDTLQDHEEWSVGAATGAAERNVGAVSSEDALATTEVFTAVEFDEVYIRPDLADGIEGLMDLVSFDADGFTTVMDDADPDAAFVGYIAFGDAAAAYLPLDQAHKPQHQTLMAR